MGSTPSAPSSPLPRSHSSPEPSPASTRTSFIKEFPEDVFKSVTNDARARAFARVPQNDINSLGRMLADNALSYVFQAFLAQKYHEKYRSNLSVRRARMSAGIEPDIYERRMMFTSSFPTRVELLEIQNNLTSDDGKDELATWFIKRWESLTDPEAMISIYFNNRDFVWDGVEAQLADAGKFDDILRLEPIINSFFLPENIAKRETTCRLLINTGASFWSKFLRSDFGANHTALQMGPLVLHWYDNGFPSINVLYSASEEEYVPIYPREGDCTIGATQFKSVCKTIALWAREFEYSLLNGSQKNNSGNCQDFSLAILDAALLTPTWRADGPIRQFIRELVRRDRYQVAKVTTNDGRVRVGNRSELERLKRMVDEYEKHPSAAIPIVHEMRSLVKAIDRCFGLADPNYLPVVPVVVKDGDRASVFGGYSTLTGSFRFRFA